MINASERLSLWNQAQQVDLSHWSMPAHWQRHGERVTSRMGSGMDYAESKSYAPGDDIRHVDWRLTARTGKPHVRRYHEEHQSTWTVILDAHASQFFGTRVRLKITQGLRIAIFLRYLAQRLGVNCHLILASEHAWSDVTLDDAEMAADAFCSSVAHEAEQHLSALFLHSKHQMAHALHHPGLDDLGSQVWLISTVRVWSEEDLSLFQQIVEQSPLQLIRIIEPNETQPTLHEQVAWLNEQGHSIQTQGLSAKAIQTRIQTAWQAANWQQEQWMQSRQVKWMDISNQADAFHDMDWGSPHD